MSGVQRASLIKSYVDNIKVAIKMRWPSIPDDRIDKLVRDRVENTIKRPKAKVIVYPSFGDMELKELDLLSVIRTHNTKVISPYGTIYESTDVKISNDKQFMDQLVSARNTAKQKMFKLIEEGKQEEAKLQDFIQALNKIASNSVSGAHGNPKNAMYDPETYNAITSMARHGVMLAYTFAERFLCSNYYFPTYEDAINFVVTNIKACPPKAVIENIVNKYNLEVKWPEDVQQLLLSGMNDYTECTPQMERNLLSMLTNVPFHQLTFIYYSRNLYNLFSSNKQFFINFFNDIFTMDQHIKEDSSIVPTDIFKLDGDLVQMMTTVFDKFLNGELVKDLPKNNPDKAIKFTILGHQVQEKLNSIKDLVDVFIHSETLIPRIHINKNMFRKAVVVSDTDSIIYTTKDLVTLYLGGTFTYHNTNVYSAHALVTYWLSKSIASMLRLMAISRGAVGEKNIGMLEMKNEYLYPVFIRTNLSKHYVGLMTIREGRVLPKPKMDIKGVGFKSSNVPSITHEFNQKLLTDIINEIAEYTNLYAGEYIARALRYEQAILSSLKSGEFTYFVNAPVKKKEEYKTPNSSIYANYEMWQEVFSEKYGEILLPNKCPLIPLVKNGIKKEKYLNWLQIKSPTIFQKLMMYLEKIGKKNITRIPLPVTIDKVPEEIVPIIDMRSIIYKNMRSTQLTLKSIGVDLGNPKKLPLFSDYYVTAEE